MLTWQSVRIRAAAATAAPVPRRRPESRLIGGGSRPSRPSLGMQEMSEAQPCGAAERAVLSGKESSDGFPGTQWARGCSSVSTRSVWSGREGEERRRGEWKMCQKELWCLPDHQLEENSVPPRRRKGWLGTPAENRQPSAATQLFFPS